ncbi:flavin-containing monooxygenase 5-like, partial [Mercenaria mercenaria]|uniref:flavin-containing monooxygenase 5-like n=1 Tax=Mercenaria mercenaria TaxID=6596 RepID=UPI00234E7FB7
VIVIVVKSFVENLSLYKFNFSKECEWDVGWKVLSLKPTETFETDGKWSVTTRSSNEKEQQHIFDAVLICTGHHAEKNIPNFPGLDTFKGSVTHTHDYKDYHGYEDKNVLIIGIGNSGGDVATELSRISSQIFLSTRSGSWIFNRVDDNGVPGDMNHSTRFNTILLQTFPNLMQNLVQKKKNYKFDHEKYCLQPKHGIFSAHPTVNDELPNRIISGGVIVKANVSEFTETGAIFEDGTKVENLDAVVLATGYIFGFPFLDKNVLDVKENKVNLYKYMFPPDLQKKSLAIIGCFQPLGAIMPMSEMQCRVATRVFKGIKGLPDSNEMWKDIKDKQAAMALRYKKAMRHTIQVDYVPYMDELAEMIGCKPDIRKLIWTDPKLATKVYFGPCTPYQYRLMGPGPWKGARQAIMTQWERVYKPLQTRPCVRNESKGFGAIYMLLVVALAVLLYLFL